MKTGFPAALDAVTAAALTSGENPIAVSLCLAEMARRVLSLPPPPVARRPIFDDGADGVRAVLRAVADFYGARPAEYLGHGRSLTVSTQRQVVMWLARRLAHASYPTIGHVLGGRDHTTVMHGVQRIDRALTENPTLREQVQALREMLVPAEEQGEGAAP